MDICSGAVSWEQELIKTRMVTQSFLSIRDERTIVRDQIHCNIYICRRCFTGIYHFVSNPKAQATFIDLKIGSCFHFNFKPRSLIKNCCAKLAPYEDNIKNGRDCDYAGE